MKHAARAPWSSWRKKNGNGRWHSVEAGLLERGELIEPGAEEDRAAGKPRPDVAAIEQARARKQPLHQRRDERKAEPHRDIARSQHERRHDRLALCAPRCRRSRHRSGSSGLRSAASSPAPSPPTSARASIELARALPRRPAGTAPATSWRVRAPSARAPASPARSAPRRNRARCVLGCASTADSRVSAAPKDASSAARWAKSVTAKR